MKNIALFTTLLTILTLIFSFTSAYAAEDLLNNAGATIKNVTEGTKNVVENVTSNAGKAVKSGVNTTENATTGTINNTKSATTNTTTTANTYGANRTSTTSNVKVAGMTATGWTWAIIAVLGVLIIASVWFYAKRNNSDERKDSNV